MLQDDGQASGTIIDTAATGLASIFDAVAQSIPRIFGVAPTSSTTPATRPAFSLTNPATWSAAHYLLIGGAIYLAVARTGSRRRRRG